MTPKEIPLPIPSVINTDDWLNEELYPSYYANRDVSKRMKKDHLKGSLISGEQKVVRAALLDGVSVKIDGHSRAEAWRRGQLEKPETLKLMTYEVENLQQMAELYRSFNSAAAAETAAEKMYHLNKLKGFEPKSRFMRQSWKTVYAWLSPKYQKDEGLAVEHYMKELEVLDSWDIKSYSRSDKKGTLFCVGVRAAMLHSLTVNKELAKVFWFAYLDEENNTISEVNQLRAVVAEWQGNRGGAAAIGNIFANAKGYFDTFVSKHT